MRRLPGPAVGRLSEGDLISGGSLRIVSGLAENTYPIFCDGSREPEAAKGCPVLREQEPTHREAYVRTRKPDIAHCALSRARPGRLCLSSMTSVPSHPPISLALPRPSSYPQDTGRNVSLTRKARRGEPFLLLGEIIMVEECVPWRTRFDAQAQPEPKATPAPGLEPWNQMQRQLALQNQINSCHPFSAVQIRITNQNTYPQPIVKSNA